MCTHIIHALTIISISGPEIVIIELYRHASYALSEHVKNPYHKMTYLKFLLMKPKIEQGTKKTICVINIKSMCNSQN